MPPPASRTTPVLPRPADQIHPASPPLAALMPPVLPRPAAPMLPASPCRVVIILRALFHPVTTTRPPAMVQTPITEGQTANLLFSPNSHRQRKTEHRARIQNAAKRRCFQHALRMQQPEETDFPAAMGGRGSCLCCRRKWCIPRRSKTYAMRLRCLGGISISAGSIAHMERHRRKRRI
jgi:hypothetical protein